MGELEPYQQRVLEELEEIDTRRGKLRAFLDGPGPGLADPAEVTRLRRQLLVMDLYVQVLQERVAAWED